MNNYFLFKPFWILLLLSSTVFSCLEMDNFSKKNKSYQFLKDTLPNGKLLFDTKDSAMVLYYKEIVGTDTLLNGNIICYGIDDSMRYLYLRKKDSLFLLNKQSIHTSPWHLGRFFEETDNHIIIDHDNGNGSPSSFSFYNKSNGVNLLGEGKTTYNYTILKDTFFSVFDNWNQHKIADSLFLFNTITKKMEGYKIPKSIPKNAEIMISELSNKFMIINFYKHNDDLIFMKKTYQRNK